MQNFHIGRLSKSTQNIKIGLRCGKESFQQKNRNARSYLSITVTYSNSCELHVAINVLQIYEHLRTFHKYFLYLLQFESA